MRFRGILLLAFFILLCVVMMDFEYLKNEEQLEKEEIARINDYFQGTFEVYRIPPWIERSPVRDEISKLSYCVYLLQTESDKQRNAPAGVPYWPCGTREKALKLYNGLSEEEKTEYMVISQSVVYIAYTDAEKVARLEEGAKYFDNLYLDGSFVKGGSITILRELEL